MIQSFIIAARDETQRKNYALKICADNKIDNFDITIIGEESTALGIDEIRNLKKNIFLRPFKSELKAIVINILNNITQEAQNSLLKILEEPPTNTIIVLTVENKELLLPTILSRCRVIQLLTANSQLLTDQLSTLNFQLSTLLKAGVGEKLRLAQEVSKNKEDAAFWLEKMIATIRQVLIETMKNTGHEKSLADLSAILRSLQKTHTLLSTTNVNPRLAMENLFLNI